MNCRQHQVDSDSTGASCMLAIKHTVVRLSAYVRTSSEAKDKSNELRLVEISRHHQSLFLTSSQHSARAASI